MYVRCSATIATLATQFTLTQDHVPPWRKGRSASILPIFTLRNEGHSALSHSALSHSTLRTLFPPIFGDITSLVRILPLDQQVFLFFTKSKIMEKTILPRTEISIIEYTDEYKTIFRQLNLEWLDHYNLTESHDLMVLDDPKGTIIDRGGVIYLAKFDGEIVGSAALMKDHDDIYELVKFGVSESYRGKGISKLLLEKCLDKAREFNASKIILFSNHQLTTAIRLYEKYGFRHVEVLDSPFETADVKMELVIGNR